MKYFTVIFCVFASLAVGCQPAPQNTESKAPPVKLPVIKNPDMTDGAAKPREWKYVWTGMGKVEVARDTEVFKGSPASLSIRSKGGYAKGNVCQHFLPVDMPFVISGFARVIGKKVDLCQVAVQVINKNFQQIGWIRLVSVPVGEGWQEFRKVVKLPPGAAHCMLTLAFHGDGQAWLDEITVTSVE